VAESVHYLHVAVCAADGRLLARTGDEELRTPLRSCLKPFQAQAMLLSGAAERFSVSDQELALACASHQGAPLHTRTAEGLLARLGLGVEALLCGAHAPGDPEGLAALAGAPPTALHNNCSGKHAGMLAAAVALGAPVGDYLQARHPVQRLIREVIASVLGLATSVDEREFAVDGCSAPTPVASLRELATMYARLAAPEALPEPLRTTLGRTFSAMAAHAELVGGRGVIDTRLMRALEGVVAKRGADGVYALAIQAKGDRPTMGVALKIESGSDEARLPAVMAVLEALGRMSPAARVALEDAIRPRRLNHRQLVVGHWDVALVLERYP
jgi:L-asparaginase II